MHHLNHDSEPQVSREAVVRQAPTAVLLSLLVAVLAAGASVAGLWLGVQGAAAARFVTVHGETVDLVGGGLYRYDTVFAGAGQRGTDAVVLLIGVPLLVEAARRYRRGSARAGLLLLGTHVFFLYVYGSAALGTVAYNRLFVVYVAIFSATLFAIAVLVSAVDRDALWARMAAGRLPRALGAFMIISGTVTLVVWGIPVVSSLVSGMPTGRLDSYATDVTYALDLAVITPVALLSGILMLRRAALATVLALSLLTLETMLAPLIAAQTVSQLAAGITFTPDEIAGPIGGFVVISAVAGWFLLTVLRAAGSVPPPRHHASSAPLSDVDRVRGRRAALPE